MGKANGKEKTYPHRSSRFPAAWRIVGRVRVAPQGAVAANVCAIHGKAYANPRGDRGLCPRVSSRTIACAAWTGGLVDHAAFRRVIHKAAAERHRRHGGDR